MKKRKLMIVLLVAGIVYSAIFAVNIFSKPAAELGHVNGRLADCPDSPNCVSSQANDEKKAMPPLNYDGSLEEATTKLNRIIEQLPGATIVKAEQGYIRATCASRIFRFVDDLEFLFNEESKQIHFRSASRVGYSDMGANRKRIEFIKDKFK